MTSSNDPQNQPGYGQQPQYGQPAGSRQQPAVGPAYGQPGYAGGYGGAAPASRRRIGIPGLIATALGVVAVIVAFTAVDWFSGRNNSSLGASGKSHFSDVHDAIGSIGKATQNIVTAAPIADPYFAWLGWVLLAAAAGCAIVACLPTPAAAAFRPIGVVVALAAAALTVFAIDLGSVDDAKLNASGAGSAEKTLVHKNTSFSYFFDHVSIGFWLATAGFVVIAIGALLGSRRTA